jgi:hypothetical protein
MILASAHTNKVVSGQYCQLAWAGSSFELRFDFLVQLSFSLTHKSRERRRLILLHLQSHSLDS